VSAPLVPGWPLSDLMTGLAHLQPTIKPIKHRRPVPAAAAAASHWELEMRKLPLAK